MGDDSQPNCAQNIGVRLLLVEDEPLTIKMLVKGLRERAYAVDVATSGREAMRHAASADYDVVILDLGLPDSDGLDLCRHLRDSRDDRAHSHPDGAGCRRGANRRAGQRRRRLPAEAVRFRRAAGAAPRA